mmetsp:Transcript_99792/g.215281  ORF Transcript_99792/g.215281 Transcript_99792/m.215281 type:complete len:235 (+) Transcript_99792:307-1011(+)
MSSTKPSNRFASLRRLVSILSVFFILPVCSVSWALSIYLRSFMSVCLLYLSCMTSLLCSRSQRSLAWLIRSRSLSSCWPTWEVFQVLLFCMSMLPSTLSLTSCLRTPVLKVSRSSNSAFFLSASIWASRSSSYWSSAFFCCALSCRTISSFIWNLRSCFSLALFSCSCLISSCSWSICLRSVCLASSSCSRFLAILTLLSSMVFMRWWRITLFFWSCSFFSSWICSSSRLSSSS